MFVFKWQSVLKLLSYEIVSVITPQPHAFPHFFRQSSNLFLPDWEVKCRLSCYLQPEFPFVQIKHFLQFCERCLYFWPPTPPFLMTRLRPWKKCRKLNTVTSFPEVFETVPCATILPWFFWYGRYFHDWDKYPFCIFSSDLNLFIINEMYNKWFGFFPLRSLYKVY